MEETLKAVQDVYGIFAAIKEMTEQEIDEKDTALVTMARIGLEKMEGVIDGLST